MQATALQNRRLQTSEGTSSHNDKSKKDLTRVIITITLFMMQQEKPEHNQRNRKGNHFSEELFQNPGQVLHSRDATDDEQERSEEVLVRAEGFRALALRLVWDISSKSSFVLEVAVAHLLEPCVVDAFDDAETLGRILHPTGCGSQPEA